MAIIRKIRKRIKEYRGKATGMKYGYAGYYQSLPIEKNTVLFESFHGREISDSPLCMAQELLKREDAAKYTVYFATNDIAKHTRVARDLDLKVKLVDVMSDEYNRVLATAEYLVNNSSFPSYYIRKEGQHYLQTWHGTPLKTLGKKMRMGMESMHNVQHNFIQSSLITFPNKFTKEAIMGDYNLNDLFAGEVALCGYPRNSIFSDNQKGLDVKNRLGDSDTRTFAYMPTWRGKNNYSISRDDYFVQLKRILTQIDNSLDSNSKMYVNLHPLVADQFSIEEYNRIEKFPEGIDKYEFLNSIDVLITDYSSVFFDYSITGKPIILFMYDYDQYMQDRGMYFDVRKLPFNKVYDTDELCKVISDESFKYNNYREDGEYFDNFIKYDSQNNTEALTDYFFCNRGELEVQDYSANLDRKWTVLDGSTIKKPNAIKRAMESIDAESEILLLRTSNFNEVMSSYLYDNYRDTANYVFVTMEYPRTVMQDIRSCFDSKLKASIKRTNYRRIFGRLQIERTRTLVSEDILGKVTGIKVSGRNIKITSQMAASFDEGKIEGVYLVAREETYSKEYRMDFHIQRSGNKKLMITGCNPEGVNFEEPYWDLVVKVVSDDGSIRKMSFAIPKKLKRKMAYQNNAFTIDDSIVFPYSTADGKLAFTYRQKTEYDSNYYKFKEIVAYFIYRICGRFISRKWIVFEKFCQMAQDNGYYFFRYCMEELPADRNRNIYYVIKKDSADWERVSKYSRNVVPFMSIRHLVYAMCANVYVASDSKRHLYIWRPQTNLVTNIINRKKILFLQHGVTALKKVDSIFGVSGKDPMTHFTTTSRMEQDIVTENFGYTADNAPILGFTRWDVLEDSKSPDNREILVMPTWRSWLEEKTLEEFQQSDYYQRYMSLLNNSGLTEMLERENVRMTFYIHPKFKDYLEQFVVDSSRISLVPFGSEPLNEIIRRCHMLITDYSSVCWDVLYLNKPVLFYQFDSDTYEKVHGSYINLKTDLPGERYVEEAELIEGIRRYIDNNFEIEDSRLGYVGECFEYRDNNNSKRTYEYLKKKGY